MVNQLYDPTRYSFNLLAIENLIATLAIFCLGVIALVRERGSRVSIAFWGVTLTMGEWLFASSWMYSAVDEHIAFQWAKVAHLGVAFVPAAVYHFSTLVLPDYEKFKGRIPYIWILSAVVLVFFITADMPFSSLYRYQWGFYPKYNVTSIPFLLFFFAVMIHVLRRLWIGYRHAFKGSTDRMRLGVLLVAIAIGYLASVDFVATVGIPLYPFGYIPIFLFIILSAYSIVHYHFLAITPAFAARQIIDTMNDALLVLDREGVIRLINKAACTLFGHNEQDLLGMPLKSIMNDNIAFVAELESLVQNGMVRNYEV
jgi:PAS domain-containing protein